MSKAGAKYTVKSGRKSWVALERDVSIHGAIPVLHDQAFSARLAQFQKALAVSPC